MILSLENFLKLIHAKECSISGIPGVNGLSPDRVSDISLIFICKDDTKFTLKVGASYSETDDTILIHIGYAAETKLIQKRFLKPQIRGFKSKKQNPKSE